MENKKVIAVVGMAGSGKTETIKYLQQKFNWPKIYFGTATFERIEQEGLEVNYENERKVREKIRAELGMGAYAILALPKIEKEFETNDVVLLESLYSWDEYKIIKEKYGDIFQVIAVYASPKTRFERLTNRLNERPISDKEEFIKRDYSEIEGTDKGGPIARADFTIVNESSLEDYHKQIDLIIDKLN